MSKSRLLRPANALFAIALVLSLALSLRLASAEGPGRAGLVVTFGDGSTVTRCIEFAEEEISGVELLQRSGLPLVTWGTGAGAAVCQIGDQGCGNPNDCFCECRGGRCEYWAYYALENGQWTYAEMGASRRAVHDGDVDGWAWGSGKPGQGATPQLLTFDQICPAIVPTVAPPPASPSPPPASPPAATPHEPPPTVATVDVPGTATVAPPSPIANAAATPTAERTAEALNARVKAPETKAEKAESETATAEAGGDFPFQVAAFGCVAAVLAGAAGALMWRRSRG